MYDLYFHKSPNTYKIAIFFEAAGLKYRTRFVNVGAGEQFEPEFIAISPNSKVPVIRDHAPADGGAPLTMFESDSILLYLARKTGLFLPQDFRGECEMMQWLFWQAACQGPMFGQSAHFTLFASNIDYAKNRYQRETRRLCQVLNDHLAGREFIAGESYTIADIACYPWLTDKARACVAVNDLDAYPHLQRWCGAMKARPEVVAGIGRLDADEKSGPPLEEFTVNMFGLDADLAHAAAERAGPALAELGVRFARPDDH